MAISLANPDMPLARFATGKLGIVRPTLARSYLVVAYRTLAGLPLDAAEQAGALTLWQRRLSQVDPKLIDPSGMAHPPESVDAAIGVWQDARALVPHAPTVRVTADYFSMDYTTVQNCLADSFHAAATRLRALVTEVPPDSDEAHAWLLAQDQVFASCSVAPHHVPRPGETAGPTKIIPTPLPASLPARARMDRDYQIAAATFYAGDLVEAERLFTAIGNDVASPYRARARYLVARAIFRGADSSHDAAAAYRRALSALDALIADPKAAAMRGAALRYRTLVLTHLKPDVRAREISVRLATEHVGGELEDLLADYTVLLDRDPAALALTAPDTDRLSAWIGVMKTPASGPSFERALAIYGKSPSPVWLVAALVSAENARDPRLTPLLDTAIATPASSQAYPTLALEWVRLSRARGVSDREVFARLQEARAHLAADSTVSTKNAFTLASAQTSPSVAEFVTNTSLVAAGLTAEPGATVPDPSLKPAIPDEVATLMQRLPLATWREAALSPALPLAARGEVTAAAWVRAMVLGDVTGAQSIATAAETANPALAAAIVKVDTATTADDRRFAFLEALLRAPRLGPDVDAWELEPTAAEAIESSSAGYLWCKVDAAAKTPSVAFLSSDDRGRAARETAALSALGAGPTFVATEAVVMAAKMPNDPRVPELLHLAVRMTRYGCRDEKNLEASRRAFEVLHSKYPTSPWAKKTPYYFGPS